MQETIDRLLTQNPFSLPQAAKEQLYQKALCELTTHHRQQCAEFQRALNRLGFQTADNLPLATYPYLPVRLFKQLDLRSVPQEAVSKRMTSSGTTGQNPSKIYLDKANSQNQTKVLTKIVTSYIGQKRLPMLIVDSQATVKNRRSFSARGAGILGFSMFGRKHTYALNEQEQIDWPALEQFVAAYGNQPVLLFGFTAIIWERFLDELEASGKRFELSNATLIHGGGWKKLVNLGIDTQGFRQRVEKLTGITRVFDYYGMVEQTGSIFMECEAGHLHCSVFSDIIIRDFISLQPVPLGQKGLIQLISLLPSSYPGHSLLSEDIGAIIGIDDCSCGRKGKYFRVFGRIPKAEARGCSDTYEAKQ